jgi:hypothetical protein
MALSKALLTRLQRRDKACWHCGQTDELSPHHRRNRGMGGSKILDRLDNLIMVCAIYNGDMESRADVAKKAKSLGHKLESWESMETSPVFDFTTQAWYHIDVQGGKTLIEHEGGLF